MSFTKYFFKSLLFQRMVAALSQKKDLNGTHRSAKAGFFSQKKNTESLAASKAAEDCQFPGGKNT
ncbi:hypothetical protein O9993_23040 [Vibrio lentus]|nr:hypothetical protein [Vibrio lentus]